MKKLIRWLPIVGVSLLILLHPAPVLADMRPPLPPSGGNLSTEADTWVQMISETVLLDVREEMAYDYYFDQDVLKYVIRVTAEFDMLNLGKETEEMQAVFPMTSVDPSASYPLPVQDFSVKVADVPVEWEVVDSDLCPYVQRDQSCTWAQFPVTFLPDEMVHVTISYRTDLGEVGAGLGYRYATYILSTGAAWHGPIWEADIILQLPYTATRQTVFDFDQYPAEVHYPEQEPVFEGNQVRWNYHSFEPEREWGVYFANPAQWVRVEEIKAALEEDPENAALWGELGSIYWDMCTFKGWYHEGLSWLGEGALEAYTTATELDPENPYYHGGFGEALYGMGIDELYRLDSTDMLEQALVQFDWAVEYGDDVEGDLQGGWMYARYDIESMIEEYLARPTQTLTPTNTKIPTKTSTPTAKPSITPTTTVTIPPLAAVTSIPVPIEKGKTIPDGITLIAVLVGIGVTILIALLAALISKRKK